MNNLVRPKIELVQDVIAVLIICKSDEDLIKTEESIVRTIFFFSLLDPQGQVTLMSIVETGPNANLYKELIPVFIICSFLEDLIRNEVSIIHTSTFPIIRLWGTEKTGYSHANGPFWSKIKHSRFYAHLYYQQV